MGHLLAQKKYRDLLVALALLVATATLVIWPQHTMQAMREGLEMCANVIIPSLFPFFVLSTMVVELGMSQYLGKLLEPIMMPLFRVNGACATALALGVVGGYPVGARTAINLYQSGQCTRTESERLLAFCNNCGPAFILGVVGAGVFESGLAGLILYLGHLCASLLVGILFRFYKSDDRPQANRRNSAQFQAVSLPAVFTKSIVHAMQASINICAFILFFNVLIRILTVSGLLSALAKLLSFLFAPLGLTTQWAQQLLAGLLEVSSGVSSLRDGSFSGRLSMAAFMLGWAGVSVHCQVLAFLGESGLSLRTYLVGKLLHGGLSAVIVGLLARHLPLQAPASFLLIERTQAILNLDFYRALALSAAGAFIVWVALLLLCTRVVKRDG